MGSRQQIDPNWKKELVQALARLGLIPKEGYCGKIEINMNNGGITQMSIPQTLK